MDRSMQDAYGGIYRSVQYVLYHTVDSVSTKTPTHDAVSRNRGGGATSECIHESRTSHWPDASEV